MTTSTDKHDTWDDWFHARESDTNRTCNVNYECYYLVSKEMAIMTFA